MVKYNTEHEVHSVDFSPDGNMLALGYSDGQIIILRSINNYERLEKCDTTRQRKACVTDLKFSPDNSKMLLAAGLDDCTIDFLEVNKEGKISRIGYCKQVPGPVSIIDWSSSGDYIKVIMLTQFKTSLNQKRILITIMCFLIFMVLNCD